MTEFVTQFASLASHQQGTIEIIDDDPKNYAFSNIFAVAAKAAPYEKTAVARNLEYVIEAIRAEGVSPWFACSHDEFVVVMEGAVEIEFVKLDNVAALAPEGKNGTVRVPGEPVGRRMGRVRLKRGHQALLPKGAAYRFNAAQTSVMIQQTIAGDLTVQKWAEICFH